MGWVALDDGFFANPKVLEAGLKGAGMYAMALSYCGKYQTDGFVPDTFLRRKAPQTVTKLCEVGLWFRVPNGYQIEDYLEYNPSREQVEERRKQAKEAAQSRWERDANRIANRNASGIANRNADRNALPSPTPTTAPRDVLVSKGSRGRSTRRLPEEHKREINKLIALVTDADADTPDVLAVYAVQLPIGAVAKVRESVELHPERVGSGYIVRALQSELAEQSEEQERRSEEEAA